MTAALSGESPVGAGLTQEQRTTDGLHSDKEASTAHALCVIEGECKAREYLARLRAEQADLDELARIVSVLHGTTLRGFCRVLAKALEVGRA